MALYLFQRGTDHVHVRQEGDKVLLLRNGKLITKIPWKAALTLAKAIRIKAKHAEENAKALDIIEDQALMMRAGMPISLTNDPAKIKEAIKEAAWNPKLRKYMPIAKFGNIESKETFGMPQIHRGEPKKKNEVKNNGD